MLLGWLLWKRRVPPLVPSVALSLLLPLDVLHAVVSAAEGSNARRLLTGVLWGIFGTSLFLRFVKRVAARFSPPGAPARASVMRPAGWDED